MSTKQGRREALDAAERFGIREGLPPVSDFARAVADRYAEDEITADEAVALIVQHYKVKLEGRGDCTDAPINRKEP